MQCNKKEPDKEQSSSGSFVSFSYTQKLTAKGKLILALTGSFGFLLALYAGLLIMLTPTDLSEDARARALTFEPFQGTLQGLVFAYTNFHFFIPPL